jgi:DNA-binding response OmpR family regulator
MTQGQNTAPLILLIESDDETRPLLRDHFRRWGYRVIMTLDEEDAIACVSHRQESPDVMVLNQVGFSIEEYISLARRMHQVLKLPAIPTVILAERYGEDLEGKTIKVSDHEYVIYLEDAQQLLTLLRCLCCQKD